MLCGVSCKSVGCALREEEGNIEHLWTSGWMTFTLPYRVCKHWRG